MTDKDKEKLLQALDDKEMETVADGATARLKGIETEDKENEMWYKGYETGMRDAKEVVEEFGRPTEDVLG